MKAKKIISLFLAIFILLVGISPNVYALENPTYTFLEGGEPRWIDVPYDMSFSDNGKSVNIKGDMYPVYYPALFNYLPNSVSLSKESAYKGLAAWNGIIFIEPKKLKNGINKIMWADYERGYFNSSYITNQDKSLFGIDILCGENGKCTMNVYAGNDWLFPSSYPNKALQGLSLNQGKMVMVENFVINRDTDPDFMIAVTVEHSIKQSSDTKLDESRVKLFVDVETKPGSMIFRKPTETTKVTAFWPTFITNADFRENALGLKFLDHTKAYSIGRPTLFTDTGKLLEYSRGLEDMSFFEQYYKNMKTNFFSYLYEIGFRQVNPTDKDLEDVGINTNSDIFNLTELKEGQTDFTFQECENFQILCHIRNAVGYLVYKIGQIFSAIFNPLISAIKNIWSGFADVIKGIFVWLFESIKNFPPIKWLIDTFHPMLVILWDYFMSYFTPIWDIFTGKTNLQDITWGDQEYICSKEPSNFIMESTTPAGKKPMEALGAFIYFINPLPPLEGAEICTGLGMKRIEYGKNTILDVFLFNIFVFAGIWFAFIGLRRYN